MMHTPMVYAIKELFHNAKTNIDNQPVGKVVSPKQECDLRQPQELSSKLQSTITGVNMATTNKQEEINTWIIIMNNIVLSRKFWNN